MAAKDVLGRRGEDLAARYLERRGLVILSRNWRCRHGEIDLVATDAKRLVVCEVKTRSDTRHGRPAALHPAQPQPLRTGLPGHAQRPLRRRETAVLRGVRRELVEHDPERLGRFGGERTQDFAQQVVVAGHVGG